MDKLLIINLDNLEFKIKVYPDAKMIKNPVPILWNYKGIYYWVPIEIIKNEITSPNIKNDIASISIHQAYRLRPDVGKMLEELANDRV